MLLVEERSLIDSEIISRYEDFIASKKVNGTKVFLSHSSKDKPTIIPLALDLEKKGITPWLDAFDPAGREGLNSAIMVYSCIALVKASESAVSVFAISPATSIRASAAAW